MSGKFSDSEFEDDESPFPEDESPEKLGEKALEQLSQRFLAALADKDAGKLDRAEEELRAILLIEPRLAEPRLELARMLLDSDRLEDAEEHAREGLGNLEKAGPWTDEIPENILKALAHALLAEVLRRRADEDDVIFGDPDEWRAILDESKREFETAHGLDPADEYASYHAFFLGLKAHAGAKAEFDDGIEPEPDES
jgi:tetratricopeptide (TPR) repeat protein